MAGRFRTWSSRLEAGVEPVMNHEEHEVTKNKKLRELGGLTHQPALREALGIEMRPAGWDRGSSVSPACRSRRAD
jgi:hypothetical protein